MSTEGKNNIEDKESRGSSADGSEGAEIVKGDSLKPSDIDRKTDENNRTLPQTSRITLEGESKKPGPKSEEITKSGELESSNGQSADETNTPDDTSKPVVLTDKDVKGFLSAEIRKLKEDFKREYLKEKEEKYKTELNVKELLSVEITKLKKDLKKEYLEEKEEKSKTESNVKAFLSVERTELKEGFKKESLKEKEKKSKTESNVKELLSVEITKSKEDLKKDYLEEKEEKSKTESNVKAFISVERTELQEDFKKESLKEKEEKSKTESDVKEFLSVEITKLKEDLKKEYLEEKEEKSKRSRKIKTKLQPFSFTTVCVTSAIWILWSRLYSTYINPFPPQLAEFATKYKTFCDVHNITDEECFQKFKCQLYPNDIPIANHTFEIGKLTRNLSTETELIKYGLITLEKNMNKSESVIENLNAKLDNCIALNENHTKQIIKLEKQGLNMSKVRENSDNTKADKAIMYLVTIILGIGELCIFVVLCTKKAQVRALRDRVENNYPAGIANMSNGIKSVLDEIQIKADLENSLCIVSFHNSTQVKHFQMVNSFIDPKIEKRFFLVHRHGDLRDIPASKIHMVFVDYNARNIILESERELGDLRKTTVKAIWKTGGNVVLVYCGDDYAEVTGNALYGHRFTSIKSRDHEELKQLEAKQCILTVKYNTFSDFQKKHLKDLIQRFLKQ